MRRAVLHVHLRHHEGIGDLVASHHGDEPDPVQEDCGRPYDLDRCREAPQIASGALVRVLERWCAPFTGYFLYYPSRRQQPPALSALIETLRL